MARRKYKFKNRAEAEQAYQDADRQRLRAEWFATAILQGRTTTVGQCKDGVVKLSVGYFHCNFSTFVYAVKKDSVDLHCIRGIWEVDDQELTNVIGSCMRYNDTYALGDLLERARTQANAKAA